MSVAKDGISDAMNSAATKWCAACGLALLLSVLLTGCIGQPRLEVASGDYTQVRGTDGASNAAASAIRNLHIDRAASLATLTMNDGSVITLPLEARDRSQWPEGCPTNIYSHYMEVLDIAEPELTIASMTLHSPVLVRDCPGEPERIVLRADGEIGGGGGAVTDSSLIFSRIVASVPHATALNP
jgi:hypothetical protein